MLDSSSDASSWLTELRINVSLGTKSVISGTVFEANLLASTENTSGW